MEAVSEFARSPHATVGNAAVVREETLAIFRICNNLLGSSPLSLKKTSLLRCGWWHDIKMKRLTAPHSCHFKRLVHWLVS